MTLFQLDIIHLSALFIVIFTGVNIILFAVKRALVRMYQGMQRKRVYRYARKHGVRIINKNNRLTNQGE